VADDPAELALRAADKMEAALDVEVNEAALPDPLGQMLRAGITILRESAAPDVSAEERKGMLRTAMAQLQIPPGVFVPHEVTLAGEAARMLADRAIRAI